MKYGVLFSGGLESTALLAYYQEENIEVELLYIKFGFLWEKAELYNAKKNIDKNIKLHVLDFSKQFNSQQLGYVDSVKKNIIPNRNLLLLSTASTYFYNNNIINISIGMQGSNLYPDTSLKYIGSLESLIKEGLEEENFMIHMPFYGLSKDQILSMYLEKIDLNRVFSCTNPIGNSYCNKCYKCMKLNKLKDRIK